MKSYNKKLHRLDCRSFMILAYVFDGDLSVLEAHANIKISTTFFLY